MRGVLGLKGNVLVKEWLRFISHDMIDEHTFGDNLNREFQLGIKAGEGGHRMFFHWPYNSEPWNKEIENRLKYASSTEKEFRDNLVLIKARLVEEQRRRNAAINNKTRSLFGFEKGGAEGKIVNRISSLVYNVHILGDYMSDNKNFYGLPDFNILVKAILEDIRTIADSPVISNPLQKKIEQIKGSDNQKKADELMKILLEECPLVLKEARGGMIKRRLEKRGFEFESSSFWPF